MSKKKTVKSPRRPKSVRKSAVAKGKRSSSGKKVDSKKLVLRVASGLNEGALFSIKRRNNVIGRKIGASIPLEDSKVSREHAAISYQNGSYFLADLSSTNGTFLNNRKVDARLKISVGDQLRVGSSIFNVELIGTKTQASRKKWGSDTKIIPLRELDPVAEEMEMSPQRPRWASLVPGFKKDLVDPESMRWVGLAIGVILIIGALLTRFNGIG